MAAEALVALGYGDAAVLWSERYRRRLRALPPPQQTIGAGNWQQALGAIERFSDWAYFFHAQLTDAPWSVVFADWIGQLLPACAAGGGHGLIRVAHAVRALKTAETPLRIEELGTALAYWAAYYRKLPGTAALKGILDLGEALAQVPLFLSGQSRPGIPREVSLAVMTAHGEEFAAAVEAAAEPADIEVDLALLTAMGARIYLANTARQPLVMLHTVTVASALRLLLDHLPGGLRLPALAYTFQTVAASVAAYADKPPAPAEPWPLVEVGNLIARSVDSRDPHVIKFTEACVREFYINPDPVYLAAAQDWMLRLQRARNWSESKRGAAGMEFR
jgi:hypothetical protein